MVKNKKQESKEEEEDQDDESEEDEESEEQDNETLEAMAEQSVSAPESDFSDFMTSSVSGSVSEGISTSVLPVATPAEPVPQAAPDENLEEIGRETPTPEPALPTARERDYIEVRNEPEYTAGTSEEDIIKGMKERGMTARTVEQLRATRPRVLMEEWHEGGEVRRTGTGDDLREYTVTSVETRDEERALPFEKQRKYKELKRG